MVDTGGATTLFLRQFCAIYVAQMSTKCWPMLKAIIVLLYFFASSIPDIVVININILYAIELTVCLETNF